MFTTQVLSLLLLLTFHSMSDESAPPDRRIGSPGRLDTAVVHTFASWPSSVVAHSDVLTTQSLRSPSEPLKKWRKIKSLLEYFTVWMV